VSRRTALILHGVNVWNTGDLGLLETTVARLREELGDDVRLWSEEVFSHDPDAVAAHLERLRMSSVPALVPLRQHRGWSRPRWLAHVALVATAVLAVRLLGWRLLRLLPAVIAAPMRALRDADVVISKAGGHLYSTADRRIGSPTYLLTIWAAGFLGRPTVIYAQSVGPFTGRLADAVARRALRGVSLATARERRSHAWLAGALPDPHRLHLTADEAFALRPEPDPEPPEGAEQPELGMTVVAWRYPGHPDPAAAARAYEDALVEMARWYVDERGGRVSLVRWLTGGHREDDRELIDRLVERIDRPGRAGAIGPFSPRQASGRLGRMEMMVSTRLHSAIFAMVAGTPAVAIEYLPKTGEIMGMAAGEGWSIPIEAVDGGRLLAKARELQSRLPEVRETVAANVPELRTRATANARLVGELLEARA
jgi:colanic acid/amylovoran biosynthesis protein